MKQRVRKKERKNGGAELFLKIENKKRKNEKNNDSEMCDVSGAKKGREGGRTSWPPGAH